MIFVDTSFWAALRNRRDDRHATATAVLKDRARSPLVTSNHVRGETWTLLRARAGHPMAAHFLDTLGTSTTTRVVFVSESLEDEALRWLERHDERAYSFVDATSFAVMRALGIRDVLTFDTDFAVAGFRTLS